MSEPDEGKEYIARLMAVMEKHIAFSKTRSEWKMTPMYKEDDLTRSDMHGMEVIASWLAFPQGLRIGLMDDTSSLIRLKTLSHFYIASNCYAASPERSSAANRCTHASSMLSTPPLFLYPQGRVERH